MGISVAQTETGSNLAPTTTSTLAQFLSALGIGSLCFCCGCSLASPTPSRADVALTCPGCGAEVVADRALVIQRAA
jgi:hypothetical protein